MSLKLKLTFSVQGNAQTSETLWIYFHNFSESSPILMCWGVVGTFFPVLSLTVVNLK